MTDNNNLAIRIQLNKTPKQTPKEHYEILWARVISSVVLAVVIVVGGTWWLTRETAPVMPSNSALATDPGESAVKAVKAKAADGLREPEPEVSTDAERAELASIAPVNPVGEALEQKPKPQPATQPQVSAPAPVVPVQATDANHETSGAGQQSSLDQPTPTVGETAPVTILKPQVAQAAISAEREQRQPGEPLPKVVTMNGENLITVYFFTEYQNLKGRWVYHDWYRKGKRMARVKSRPHQQIMQAYSSKYIDRHMLGDWQVRVTTQEGEVLARADFTVAM